MSDGKRVYKVIFLNQGQVFEVFAREVSQGSLYGFIEVEGLLFGERSKVVVDPSEEKLRHEFGGVRRFYVPLHAVVRIDEVDKQGSGRVSERQGEGNLAPFPSPLLPGPTGPGSEES